MQRNFGRNSSIKPVLAETEIRECSGQNYLNFRAFILTAEQWPSGVRKNWEASSFFSNQNNYLIFWKWLKIVKKISEC